MKEIGRLVNLPNHSFLAHVPFHTPYQHTLLLPNLHYKERNFGSESCNVI
jgi:hypothetical protein